MTQRELRAKGEGRREAARQAAAQSVMWHGARVTQTYYGAAGGAGAREKTGASSSADEPRGLSGNTKGSEGYGEVTQGSLQRLCCLLGDLREHVLTALGPPGTVRPPPTPQPSPSPSPSPPPSPLAPARALAPARTHYPSPKASPSQTAKPSQVWPRAWDLRSESSLVDVGSGYPEPEAPSLQALTPTPTLALTPTPTLTLTPNPDPNPNPSPGPDPGPNPDPDPVPNPKPCANQVGSGYGKAVLHFALSQRLRRAVGIECVISRHEIAQQALLEVRAIFPGHHPLPAIFPGYHPLPAIFPGYHRLPAIFPGYHPLPAIFPGYHPLPAIFPGYHRPTMRASVVRGLTRASL